MRQQWVSSLAAKTRVRHRSSLATVILSLLTLLVYAYLFAPILVVIIASFNTTGLTSFPPAGFTVDWYRELVRDRDLLAALRRSLTIAVTTALLTASLATATAIGLRRLAPRWRRFLQAFFYLPIVVPGIVAGIALVFWFKRVGVPLGYPSILLAHIVHAFPYALALVLAAFSTFDTRLEEASLDLGATPWHTFRRVTLPLIAPGVLGGMLLAFTLSFDEFVLTFFVTGGGITTLPLEIYNRIRFLISPVVNAVAAFVLLVSMTIVLVTQLLVIRRR
ncbi:ABC transporter permease [Thermomicrobium sp.]|jgi:spermidine/putrescine transport system permease protein|uniref:ABC transporter permease n=1 Tax=Thermomicrobium sp. TaxID=1969469 RepID=UPI001B0576AE|nr:ABC transporter permease [Thermomicrobium sp.]MBO9307102.1 ABC transporter permease [Thermomicrobium sp.]MBO9350509.1 ABC transporter permease [Thermomicrobium sp.]